MQKDPHALFAKFRPVEHILGGFGVLLLIGGIAMLVWTVSFIGRAETASAVVVSRVTIASGNGKTNTPRFELTLAFTDQSGAVQQASTSVTTTSDYAPIGTQIDIFYDPHKPASIRIDDWMNTWGFIILILLGGAVFLRLAIWMRVAYLKLHKVR